MAVKVGDKAPEFSLKDQTGAVVDVKFGNGTPSVVFFYPKSHTPGCTMEAKAFRDAHADFQALGATVYGISGDSVDSQASFCSKLDLPYTLLADEGDRVRKEVYGVAGDMFGLLPGRQTYVIGGDGIVKLIFRSQINAKKHVAEALKVLSTQAA